MQGSLALGLGRVTACLEPMPNEEGWIPDAKREVTIAPGIEVA